LSQEHLIFPEAVKHFFKTQAVALQAK
jgi:hypothetical protein